MQAVLLWDLWFPGSINTASNKLAGFLLFVFKWLMDFIHSLKGPFISMLLSGKIQIVFVLYAIRSPVEANNTLPPPSFADDLFGRAV